MNIENDNDNQVMNLEIFLATVVTHNSHYQVKNLLFIHILKKVVSNSKNILLFYYIRMIYL